MRQYNVFNADPDAILRSQVLTALDAKLDGVINTAAGVAGAPAAFLSGKQAGANGSGSELDHVVAAKHAYLRAIEDAVLLVKVQLIACYV